MCTILWSELDLNTNLEQNKRRLDEMESNDDARLGSTLRTEPKIRKVSPREESPPAEFSQQDLQMNRYRQRRANVVYAVDLFSSSVFLGKAEITNLASSLVQKFKLLGDERDHAQRVHSFP
jgi:hypothetical protein